MVVASDTVTQHELSLKADLNVPGLAEASIKGEWQFGKKRGALLIMDRPRISHIPPNELLKQLVDVHTLEDKVLVTEVVSWPAYSLYLSSKQTDLISLALLVAAPQPGAVASVGGGSKWWKKNATGLLRSACDNAYSFSPLFALKKIPKKGFTLFRDGQVATPEGDDLWVDAQPPWGALDEDGEEEPFEDTIFYDEWEEEPMGDASR